MITKSFFDYYKCLPTTFDQKVLRDKVLREAKVKQKTWYSWVRRNDIPDIKARVNITKILIEITGENQDINILFPNPVKRPCSDL